MPVVKRIDGATAAAHGLDCRIVEPCQSCRSAAPAELAVCILARAQAHGSCRAAASLHPPGYRPPGQSEIVQMANTRTENPMVYLTRACRMVVRRAKAHGDDLRRAVGSRAPVFRGDCAVTSLAGEYQHA